MTTWKLMKNVAVMAAVLLGLGSCNLMWQVEEDMDVHKSIKFAGQWTGDFGMYYNYRYHGRTYTFDSYDTDIVFYPNHDGATYGWGKQVDYYEQGPYSHIYNRFNWEIRNGVVYLQYYNDSSLDCAIYDYVMTSDRFQGRFGSSKDKFFLKKIADYYDWTIYVDYYFFYPNNGWYWSPMYTRQASPDTLATDPTGTESQAAEDGILSFGKRL